MLSPFLLVHRTTALRCSVHPRTPAEAVRLVSQLGRSAERGPMPIAITLGDGKLSSTYFDVHCTAITAA